MTPYYVDDWLTMYGGDCLDVMRTLPADSVDCVVTSPPYWGLRDYGTATWEGGEEGHDHIGSRARTAPAGSAKQASKRGSTDVRSGDCSCGAQRVDSQLGLERTPEEYVANMVNVFREVRRVLKPSGTCWLNLGDSYAGYWGDKTAKAAGRRSSADTNGWTNGFNMNSKPDFHSAFDGSGIKPKDLVGIPWRVAFALQADGWYLRSDIIWAKPNPMPESVTDRPTKSHEYLFLLTKSARYYFDAEAVAEASVDPPGVSRGGALSRFGPDEKLIAANAHRGNRIPVSNGRRNIRSVWNIATRPYPGAHFAVFPPELPERCIKAGSSEKGVCPECGAPWERTVVKSRTFESGSGRAGNLPVGKNGSGLQGGGETLDIRRGPVVHVETTGWRPTCANTSDPIPATILDPFGGSGTVGMVANRLSRRAILIDLNPEYLKQQMKRNAQTPLGLTDGIPA